MPAKMPELLTPWICRISRLSTIFMGKEMAKMGFSPGQFYFLFELYAEEGLSQDELSRRVGVDKSNTSRALAKLESDGLIYRKPNPENYKEKNVYLQTRAFEIRDEFRAIQRRWNEKLLRDFPAAQRRALFVSLMKMTDNGQSALGAEVSHETPQRKAS